ncbi:NADH-quinone oxidoreductase subunit L [Alkalihalobacterium chitinilyticum]|uniref:NADH-quinone oxidoreductase subunit L n=1 Tax=Alkalihalobacterium chitinilyticum TaxID=2980103 RepID=A0ABT5VGY2_9BACI|nr:NADH-quinone oxidoreductase subunit L [Alkalihalobacterium chitinilyticum]MDE5414713.1 NADH-quinone oxidoreductase subunit L [Alkalihalobacterium chitinilyticum]
MMEIAWLIPLLPLLSFVILVLFGRRLKESGAYVGMVLSFIALIMSILVLFERMAGENVLVQFDWLAIGDRTITMGFEVNQLNALMLVIVTLVSFLVHTYSKGYMTATDSYRVPVFYSYLGLFTFSMLGLVLSPNLLQLYIFWELVGVCSFLLVGFYFFKTEARAAAKKAFIVTRIGDVGLFIGMILLFWQVGSFEYAVIFETVNANGLTEGMITLIAILIFVGAIGKSGQFPLHTWLPDAMEGPTPVSALIHAATMVAAGVYLVATIFPLFAASPVALTTVAVIGGFTAIFAATIALTQKDIKRVLAYSTVSQLGYMMLALGSAGYVAAVFHLMTHAFFKALLFLAAGSVIHAVHTQSIEEMGGLWKKMKTTGVLFLIGCLAIAGFPLFSGFFSKEEILLTTFEDGRYVLFALALITALLTAIYMFRLFFMVFTGKPRGDQSKVHESPAIMTVPMMVLAVLAVVSGFVHTHWFGTFLGDWLSDSPWTRGHTYLHDPGWIMPVAILVSLLGIFIAWLIYGKGVISREKLAEDSSLYMVLYNKYYIDELYNKTFVRGTTIVSYTMLYIEKYIIEFTVQAVVGVTDTLGRLNARLQNGQVQTYGAVAFLGLVIILAVLTLTGGYFR